VLHSTRSAQTAWLSLLGRGGQVPGSQCLVGFCHGRLALGSAACSSERLGGGDVGPSCPGRPDCGLQARSGSLCCVLQARLLVGSGPCVSSGSPVVSSGSRGSVSCAAYAAVYRCWVPLGTLTRGAPSGLREIYFGALTSAGLSQVFVCITVRSASVQLLVACCLSLFDRCQYQLSCSDSLEGSGFRVAVSFLLMLTISISELGPLRNLWGGASPHRLVLGF
jgi:hypothetical protein